MTHERTYKMRIIVEVYERNDKDHLIPTETICEQELEFDTQKEAESYFSEVNNWIQEEHQRP